MKQLNNKALLRKSNFPMSSLTKAEIDTVAGGIHPIGGAILVGAGAYLYQVLGVENFCRIALGIGIAAFSSMAAEGFCTAENKIIASGLKKTCQLSMTAVGFLMVYQAWSTMPATGLQKDMIRSN